MTTQTIRHAQTLLRPKRTVIRNTAAWRVHARHTLAILLLLLAFGLVGWLYLNQARLTADTNRDMVRARLDLEASRRRINELHIEIAKWQSPVRLEERARQLGLGPAESISYLPVANFPIATAPEAPGAARLGKP